MGMKQRLGIAAALLGDPDLLILDEPINGLDPAGVHEIRGLIGRLADGRRTVFVSSHVLTELEQVCDWLIVVDHGALRLSGAGVRPRPCRRRDRRRARARGRPAAARAAANPAGHDSEIAGGEILIAVNGSQPRQLAADVNRTAGAEGIVLAELGPHKTTLEDRYLATVNGGQR